MTAPVNFQQLVDGAGDAVMVSNAGGAIVYWNAACERLFGFSAQEAMGQSLDLIIPQRQQGRHWEGYHKTMASGITRYGTSLLKVPAVHKEGKPLSIAFTVSLLTDAAGAVEGIVAIVRDDTQRFNDERTLRKRIAELEAKAAS